MPKHTVLLLCLVVGAPACAPAPEGPPAAPSPSFESPAPPAPAPGSAPRPISLGDQIHDALTLHGTERRFEVTVRSDGTLVVHLSWPPERGRLELTAGEMQWTGAGVSEAAMAVEAGRTYRLSVADGAPWDYGDFFVPFVLTTSIRKASTS